LLSVLIGMLVGALLALALLRGRLPEALGTLLPGRRAGRRGADRNGKFDASIAAAAFDRSSRYAADAEPLPITGPAEMTYIVEASDDAATINDSAELARLFDDPTTELPQQAVQSPAPMAEIPRQDGDEILDPTAELPDGALDDIFDPSGADDANAAAKIEPSLVQAFDENLENLDPDVMFATANQDIEELMGETDGEALDITVEAPLDNSLDFDPTVESDLSALPVDDEDDALSATLREALDLLKRDYQDEFTASQLLERSSLEKSLEEERDRNESKQPAARGKRKAG
jgi:hypothetical protein